MLPVSNQQVASSIRRLEPVDRTLLDLSVRRGVDNEIIADVLHVDELEITRRRDRVLEAVADHLGLAGPEERVRLPALLESLPESHWREPPGPRRQRRRRRRWRSVAAAVGLAAVVAGVTGLVVAGGGGGHPAPPRLGGIPLAPVSPGGPGRGGASLHGGRLRLEVAGLPALEEPYEVWLYNSVTDAAPLTQRVGGDFAVTARLPPDARRYRFIDISREPLDGNPNHSGASVLRIPLARLLKPSSGRRSRTVSGR